MIKVKWGALKCYIQSIAFVPYDGKFIRDGINLLVIDIWLKAIYNLSFFHSICLSVYLYTGLFENYSVKGTKCCEGTESLCMCIVRRLKDVWLSPGRGYGCCC